MRKQIGVQAVLGSALAIAMYVASGTFAGATAPLAINSARITIDGTSNIHPYTASTSVLRVTRAELGGAFGGPDFWAMPGGVQAFEVAIPAATLSSPREGVDKNMHKALKVQEHANITFHLVRFEAKESGAAKAAGLLQIAGVEHQVTFDVETKRTGLTLAVQGKVELLMTDYGITPPKALLGMLKTDPRVTVTFEAVLTMPLT